MLAVFLQGAMLGFGASVPIGPVNLLIISHALKSYKNALALGLGAMSADVVYLFLMTLGLLQVFEYEIVKKTLAIFGFVFLLIIAFMLFKSGERHLSLDKNVKSSGFILAYMKGFLLTMLNPYTVGFWLSIASIAASQDFSNIFTLLFGLVSAILLWITVMPYFVWKNKRFVSQKTARYFSYTAGVILIFFAFVLLYGIFVKEIV